MAIKYQRALSEIVVWNVFGEDAECSNKKGKNLSCIKDSFKAFSELTSGTL